VFKPSRRAVVIAASFALGLSCVGPYAHAGLLGGGDDSSVIESIGLPVGGDLVGGLLGGGLLGGDLLGGLLGGDLLGGVLGGDLLGDGLPLVGGVLGEDSVLGGDLLDSTLGAVTATTLDCDAAIPQVLRSLLGEVTGAVCEPFSNGVLGLLGSL
jgi:hypothetical protein